MPDLSRQRCRNHAQREAVALCPACSGFYCRECVSEHEGRVICASCLAGLAVSDRDRSGVGRILGLSVPTAVAFLVAWMCFYALGQALLGLPDAFHSGEMWQGSMWDAE